MQSLPIHENLVFHDSNPYAEPLFVAPTGRILRFALRPGQTVRNHTAPSSPVYLVTLQGAGLFSGEDGEEHRLEPGTLVIFDVGERHAIRAEDEELVFLAFLHGAPLAA
jgi:quercetin dioxygenase-like cupin family protein